jgi:hypothetical protein
MTGVAQGAEAMLPGQPCIFGLEQTPDHQVTLSLLPALLMSILVSSALAGAQACV